MTMRKIEMILPINDTKQGNQVVSGRDLYEFLGAKADFPTWFKRMLKYGFTKDTDFIVIPKIVEDDTGFGGHRRVKDYAMTLDMAKEVAMIQRTDKGKQARQYFIQVEKEYKLNVPKPMSATERLRLATQSIGEIDDRVSNLENTMEITTDDQYRLRETGKNKVLTVLGGKNSNAYRKLSRKVFAQMWRDFKHNFYLPRYAALPKKQLNTGLNFVKTWQPDEVMSYAIQGLNNQTDLDI